MSFEKHMKSAFQQGDIDVPRKDMWTVIEPSIATSKSAKSNSRKWLYAAVALILVAGIVGMFYQQNQRIGKLEEQIAKISQEESVPLKVQYLHNLENQTLDDDQIADVLIDRLQNDKSAHVRLAAVRAIEPYIGHPTVRAALVEQLGIEADPYIQIGVIRLLVSVKEQGLLPMLIELKNEPVKHPSVDKEVKRAIALIS